MNDKLSDAFKSVIPEPPPTTGWVAGARRKRRNTRLAISGVAAAAVVALAIPVALNLPSVREPLVASPAPTPSATASSEPTQTPSVAPTQTSSPEPTIAPTDIPSPDPVESPGAPSEPGPTLEPAGSDVPGSWACYNEDGRAPLLNANTGEDLPTGVGRAFLCGDGHEGFGVVGPLDPLVIEPDRIIELFEAQPEYVEVPDCGYEASDPYRIVLEYLNGDKWIISGYGEECQPLTDGTTQKAGEGFRDKVVALWQEQRAAVSPPAPPAATDALNCAPAQYPMIPMTLGDATAGIFCSQLDQEDPVEKVVLAPELVDRLVQAATSEAVAGYPEAAPGEASGTLILTNGWGDIFPVMRHGDQYAYVGDSEMMVWTPQDELAQALDNAFG